MEAIGIGFDRLWGKITAVTGRLCDSGRFKTQVLPPPLKSSMTRDTSSLRKSFDGSANTMEGVAPLQSSTETRPKPPASSAMAAVTALSAFPPPLCCCCILNTLPRRTFACKYPLNVNCKLRADKTGPPRDPCSQLPRKISLPRSIPLNRETRQSRSRQHAEK